MKEFMYLAKRYKKGLILGLLVTILIEAIASIVGQMQTKMFSVSISNIGTDKMMMYIGITITIYIIYPMIIKIGADLYAKYSFIVMNEYRSDIHSKVVSLSVPDLQSLSIPSVTTAVNSAPDVINNIYTIVLTACSIVVSVVTAGAMLTKSDWRLSLIVSGISIGLVLWFTTLNKKINLLSVRTRETKALIDNGISRLSAFMTIKGFSTETQETKKFKEVSNSFHGVCIEKTKLKTTANTCVYFISSILNVTIVIFLAITYDGDPKETMEKAILFSGLASSIFKPLMSIQDIIDMKSLFEVNSKMNNDILRMTSEADGDVNLSEFSGNIEFKNVAFSYSDSGNTLNDVNLMIPKGKKVGIYGPSGSGKSTFVNLLNRYYPVDSGEILIDGININKLTKKSLRHVVGNVSQKVTLFSDMSIKDNIMYGMSCTEAEMLEAARKAHVHDFVKDLPNGYDTMVGNNGTKLSGGESQRIALARLFLLNPPILILDEATSALDNETEALIKESIEKLSEDKTVISIAHRLDTICDSDMFVGIKNHGIYECGTRDEISKQGTLWSSLRK